MKISAIKITLAGSKHTYLNAIDTIETMGTGVWCINTPFMAVFKNGDHAIDFVSFEDEACLQEYVAETGREILWRGWDTVERMRQEKEDSK